MTPATLEQLMAQACALERQAAQRYTEFADILQAHNNAEVAAMFRALAQEESGHADAILQRMGWRQAPATQGVPEVAWMASLEQAHYLMQPWHALQVALQAELQACEFYAELAPRCTDPALQRAARALEAEEREHIALLQSWLERVPVPQADWADDPDPPRYTD